MRNKDIIFFCDELKSQRSEHPSFRFRHTINNHMTLRNTQHTTFKVRNDNGGMEDGSKEEEIKKEDRKE